MDGINDLEIKEEHLNECVWIKEEPVEIECCDEYATVCPKQEPCEEINYITSKIEIVDWEPVDVDGTTRETSSERLEAEEIGERKRVNDKPRVLTHEQRERKRERDRLRKRLMTEKIREIECNREKLQQLQHTRENSEGSTVDKFGEETGSLCDISECFKLEEDGCKRDVNSSDSLRIIDEEKCTRHVLAPEQEEEKTEELKESESKKTVNKRTRDQPRPRMMTEEQKEHKRERDRLRRLVLTESQRKNKRERDKVRQRNLTESQREKKRLRDRTRQKNMSETQREKKRVRERLRKQKLMQKFREHVKLEKERKEGNYWF